MQETSAHQRESVLDALAASRARVSQLECEAVARDVANEPALRAVVDRYTALILSIAEVTWTSDPAGNVVAEQPSWALFTGQAIGEYRLRGWLGAVHPEDRAAALEGWNRAISCAIPYESEHRLRRHDGEYRSFSVLAVPVRDEGGRIREWAGIYRDISEGHLANHALHQGVKAFWELADSMPQIVWAADPQGCFDYYNRRWYEFTGRPEGIRGDQSWTDVVHPDDQVACLARWHEATRSGDAYEIEYRLRAKEGSYHWFLRRALPVRDDAGHITRWYGTCTNIDAVKVTETALRRANAEMDASNRELEAFSYSVAHDLRSPLRGIDGFSQAVLEDNGHQLDEAGKANLGRVRAASQRMGHLIDSLLSLSRLSRSDMRREPVDVTRVARAVGEGLRAMDAPRDVELVVQEGMIAHADRHLLGAVFENLLANAWKFTSRQPKARIEVGVSSRDGQTVYFVRDDGAGFDMIYADKLFGTFQRLHGVTEYPGTGIGLATVQRIVHRHGGQIWAEGKVAHGATFFFTLGDKVDL